MNRRWFLGASLAVVGSVFVPKYDGWFRQGTGEPHLWGDGLHDDTAALQWRIDRAHHEGKVFYLSNGLYRVDRTVNLRGRWQIHNNAFLTGPQVRNGQPILTL